MGTFSLDAYLDGLMLIYRHRDVPGLIGFIGTVFGKHGVNIAHMSLGRDRSGGKALGALNTDSRVSDAVAGEVEALPGILWIRRARI